MVIARVAGRAAPDRVVGARLAAEVASDALGQVRGGAELLLGRVLDRQHRVDHVPNRLGQPLPLRGDEPARRGVLRVGHFGSLRRPHFVPAPALRSVTCP